MNGFKFELLNPSDNAAVEEYEAAFYQSFSKVTTNRLVQKLWLWDHETGRLKTRVPYQDQLICALRDQAGRLRSAMAFNIIAAPVPGRIVRLRASAGANGELRSAYLFRAHRTNAPSVFELLVKLPGVA